MKLVMIDYGMGRQSAGGEYAKITAMGKHEKLLLKILSGSSNANIHFDELCDLLKHLGFEVRIRGSHHLFRKEGVAEKINLQRDGNKAKSYQVRQVRSVIIKYKLGGGINV